MLHRLPEEIEISILNYLYTLWDIKKFKCISKNFFKKINYIKYIQEKKLLENRTFMIIEEFSDINYAIKTNGYYQYQNNDLADSWEKYHKYNWPIRKDNIYFTPLWKINTYVDVLDKIGVWGSAIIIDHKIEKVDNEFLTKKKKVRKYLIQFLGWNNNFNEWIGPDKITFFGYKTVNPRNKYKYLTGEHRRWCLYYDNNKWDLVSIRVLEEDKEKKEKKIHLSSFFSNIVSNDTITPDNIESKLRSISNGTVFLSIRNNKFNPYHRKLLF
jgi:hypothetical protein